MICEAFDEDMNSITVKGFGLFARALCHETDHLDGILYPDVAEEPAKEDVTMEEGQNKIVKQYLWEHRSSQYQHYAGTDRSP